MTLEQALITAIASNAGVVSALGSRLYVAEAPREAAMPYALFVRDTTEQTEHQGGGSNLVQAFMSVNIFAETYSAANSASDAIQTALDAITHDVEIGTTDIVPVFIPLPGREENILEKSDGEAGVITTIRLVYAIWYKLTV